MADCTCNSIVADLEHPLIAKPHKFHALEGCFECVEHLLSVVPSDRVSDTGSEAPTGAPVTPEGDGRAFGKLDEVKIGGILSL